MKTSRAWAVLIVVLLAGVAAQAGPRRAQVKVKRGATVSSSVFVRASTLCAALSAAADTAGGWWCLNGDGTMASGSAISFGTTGSLTTLARPVCPNGDDCASEVMTRFNADSAIVLATQETYQATTATTAPTGSFTTCALGIVDSNTTATGGSSTQVMLSNLTTVNEQWLQRTSILFDAQPGLVVLTPTAGSGCVTNSGVINTAINYQRFPALWCGVFESGVRTRSCTFDQFVGLTCTNFTHACTAVRTGSYTWTVGRSASQTDVTQSWEGYMRGAFMTEKILTDADMTLLGTSTMPMLSGPAGMTFTRASKKTCCAASTRECTFISNNVPCISGGVTQVESAGENFNSVVRGPATGSTDCDGACGTYNWTTTANNGYTVFGMRTAYRHQLDATPLNVSLRGLFSGTVTGGLGAAITGSFYIKGVSTSGVIDVCGYDGSPVPPPFSNGYTCSPCSYNSTTFTRCSATIVASSTASPSFWFGNLSAYSGVARSAADFWVDAFQLELGSTATSYMHYPVFPTRAAESCSGTGCP